MIGVKVDNNTYDYKDYYLLYKNAIIQPKRVSHGSVSVNFFCNDKRFFGRIFFKGMRIEEFETKLIHRDDLKDYAEYMI